jgi:hypothetical protein
MAELHASPLESMRTLASTWPADERDWVEWNSGALAEDIAEAARARSLAVFRVKVARCGACCS